MAPEPLDYRSRDADDERAALVIVCPHCGGTNMVEGSLQSSSVALRFLPKRVKSFWTYNNGVAAVTYACLSCGSVVTVLKPDDLRRLIDGNPPSGPAAT